MGNRLSFVFLLISVIFIQNAFAQLTLNTLPIDMCKNMNGVIVNDGCKIECPANTTEISRSDTDLVVRCQCNYLFAPSGEKALTFSTNPDFKTYCPSKPPDPCPPNSDFKLLEQDGRTWDLGNSDYITNGYVCECRNTTNEPFPKRLRYVLGGPNNFSNDSCPESSNTSSAAQLESCFSGLEEQIRSCAGFAENTIQKCDEKSDKNAGIQNTVDRAAQATSAMLQNSAANSGSVDKCRQAGLLSNAAGYGVGMINSSCKDEIGKCVSKCETLRSYADANKLREYCSRTPHLYTQQNDNESDDAYVRRMEKLEDKILELSGLISKANEQCASETGSGNTKAGQALAATSKAITSYVSASQQAAACEQALANTQSFVPLTMNCALGGGVNCPVNCVTNPSDPKCKSVSSTSGSQMAGGTNKLDTSSLATGLGTGTSASTTGSSGLDLSSLNNGSGSTAEAQKLEASGAMFGSAGAASAGGAGGTAAASANAAGGTEAGDEGSSQGGIGGAFKALRSAAGNLFNGSGLFGSKANSDKIKPNNNALNQKNSSMIRGLANANRNSCFIDSKGQSFCFGPKHKSIFDIMSTQYANQTPSLLRD